MIILGAAGCGAVGVYMDMDWFIRAVRSATHVYTMCM